LIEAKNTAINAQITLGEASKPCNSNMAPIIIIPAKAFVTDIKGVCNAGVTLQITLYPSKIERQKTNMEN